MKNWRPVSLLNSLSEKLKKVLQDFISTQQTVYVKNRHIGEGGRLISDTLEINRLKKLEGFLVTMDIEKAFDLLDHNFRISTLEKYGFGKSFILWVKVLLRNQESCVINGGLTTKYFSLRRGGPEIDPILDFLFVLAQEVLFILIKSRPEIERMKIFDYNYNHGQNI